MGPSGAWAIPQPGNLGVGDLVDAGVRLWLREWVRLALLTLILSGVASFLVMATGGWTLGGLIDWLRKGADPLALPEPSPFAMALSQAHSWILTPILIVAVFRTAMGGAAGSRLTLGKTMHLGLVRLPQALWLLVAGGIIFIGLVIGCFILLLILTMVADEAGLWTGVGLMAVLMFVIYARLSLAPAALVMEDERGFKALGRSWDLTSDRTWRTLAVLLLAAVMVLGGSIAGVLLELAVPGRGVGVEIARAAIQAATTAAVAPLGYCILSVLYLDLVARPRGGLRADEARAWLRARDPV